jgi:mono/diheme cytochrome c family protein
MRLHQGKEEREMGKTARFAALAALAAIGVYGLHGIVLHAGEGRGAMDGHMRGGKMMGRGMMRGGEHEKGMPVHFMKRHMTYRMEGLPLDYMDASNPLAASAENIGRGAALYRDNCASCHGAKGAGDGEAGQELDPRPTNIAFTLQRPVTTDEFLLWTLSEGGEPFGTAMPPFKDILSKKEIWQIALFMRDGFRAAPVEEKDGDNDGAGGN